MQVQTKGIRSIFEPRALALIGVTEDPQSPGHIILRNLLEGGYQGRLFAIGAQRAQVLGLPVHRTLQDIDQAIDLALIAAPAEALSAAIEQCGKRRMAGALIYDHGVAGRRGAALNQRLADEARRYGLRLLGPQSHGIARPAISLNATFTYSKVTPGKVALISQSGALVSAILDWAGDNAIGFSSVISLGSASDIAFWESLDYLAADPQTDSILLYVEGIRHPRRFMSSLRAAARTKPVIVFKAGRQPAGSQAAHTHSRAMVGSDQVFNAALSRAGAVRVDSFVQLFSAAQCLSSRYRAFGNRIAIVSNGAGPGIIAADWAADCGIEIAAFSPETLTRLEAALPAGSSRANPLDLLSDAAPQRYGQILSICLEDSQVDGVLAILTPQPASQPMQTAQTLIQLSRAQDKPVVACWMGDAQVQPARATLAQALVPAFRTPEPAVESFSHVAGYYRNQKLLMQVPGPLSRQEHPDLDGAKLVIDIALAERRKVLNEMESKALLAAFRIPVAHTMVARSPSEAIMIAEQIGFPVALKVSSPDIAHKSAVNGVRLNVANARAAHSAYLEIVAEVPKRAPEARIEGVSVQPMSTMTNARELLIGVVNDPVFGPVIAFGAGGVSTELIADRAVALPPLNRFLAQDLVARTRVSATLDAHDRTPAANRQALESLLLRVSEMACELPWLKEMDINPLIVDQDGALALDARIVIDEPGPEFTGAYSHMAIHPYPAHLERESHLADGTVIVIRPVRPEDGELVKKGFSELSSESRYFRFMNAMAEMPESMLVRFTQIDYDREMALVATTSRDGSEIELGVVRYIINPDAVSCEFALVVLDGWQRRGIGSKLMLALIEAARAKGLKTMEGDILASNERMLQLVSGLGFSLHPHEDDPSLMRAVRELA